MRTDRGKRAQEKAPDSPASLERDNATPSNRAVQPAQGEEGRREDELHRGGSRIEGPGFGKGSNVP